MLSWFMGVEQKKCRLIRKYTIVSNATKGTTARYTTSKKIKKQCKKLSRF